MNLAIFSSRSFQKHTASVFSTRKKTSFEPVLKWRALTEMRWIPQPCQVEIEPDRDPLRQMAEVCGAVCSGTLG
jgi:hypothetical protein